MFKLLRILKKCPKEGVKKFVIFESLVDMFGKNSYLFYKITIVNYIVIYMIAV